MNEQGLTTISRQFTPQEHFAIDQRSNEQSGLNPIGQRVGGFFGRTVRVPPEMPWRKIWFARRTNAAIGGFRTSLIGKCNGETIFEIPFNRKGLGGPTFCHNEHIAEGTNPWCVDMLFWQYDNTTPIPSFVRPLTFPVRVDEITERIDSMIASFAIFYSSILAVKSTFTEPVA